ncbi:hypothetical protein CAPTEDRAFT_179867 [Capitella teleta]|uniref:C2H2-type domain-containing protein n=1 Tax=Capitella teleta TaxID=283909 RepID=R7T4A2_CAPTE|nr:hypothetical protein CAPTEDRAFT_179867 [Capitella teleta]|eukprot:ELT87606.1 hypothetical protein CAPTEDRAFT_179867 [Capitella teleta]
MNYYSSTREGTETADMMKYATRRRKAVTIPASDEIRSLVAEAILRVCKDKLSFATYLHVSGRLLVNLDDRTVFSLPVSETCAPSKFTSTDNSDGEEKEETLNKSLPRRSKRKRNAASAQVYHDLLIDNTYQDESKGESDICPGGDVEDDDEVKEDALVVSSQTNEENGELVAQCGLARNDVLNEHLEPALLTCELCDERFFSQQEVETHVGLVHDRQLLCDDCRVVFTDTGAYETHMRMHHDVDAPLVHKCKSCAKEFSKKTDLQRHKQTDHFTKCSVCERTFSSRQAQVKHELQEHATSSMFTCDLCQELCTSVAALRKHKERHKHKERGGIICDICGKSFSDRSSLHHHKKGIHTNEKPFSCTQCDSKFNFSNSLKLHMLKHKGVRPHKCQICDRSYLTANHLKSHMLGVHAAEKPFVCMVCDKQFPYENSLRMHMLLHTSERPFKCKHCAKGFVSKNGLKGHEATHNDGKRFMCSVCRKMFKTESQQKAHMRRHTEARTRFMCDICGSHFMFKSTLLAHIPTHENSTANECSICHKTFKTYSSLYSHKLVHSNAKPFVCSVCNKGFKTRERLRIHEQRHLGLKPFSCSQCGNCFPDKGGLAKHIRTVHSRKMKYACPVCRKESNRADNLRVHMKIHGDPSLLTLPREQLLTNEAPGEEAAIDDNQPKTSVQPNGAYEDQQDLSFMIQVADSLPQQMTDLYPQPPPQLAPVEVIGGQEIQHLQPLTNVQPLSQADAHTLNSLAQAHAELQAQADGAVALAQLSAQSTPAPAAVNPQQPQISLQQLQEYLNAQEMQRKLQQSFQ